MKVIFISGPFRGENAWEVENNIRVAENLALQVWKLGAAAVCPHTNTRFFSGAAPDNVWLEGDKAILQKCDAVIMTHNWRRSDGATAEYHFAVANNIPVLAGIDSLEHWLKTEGKQ